MHDIFKTVPWRKHGTQNGFFVQQRENLVEDCKCSGHPSTCCTEENLKKIYIIINQDQQGTILETAGKTGLLYGNMSANSKGRLEHVVDLCEVCASVAC